MLARLARDLDAAQHARELLHPLVRAERRDRGAAATAVGQLDHAMLVVRLARDLREMSDAEHLSALAELAKPPPDDLGDAAADAGVDLVEDHAGAGVAPRRGD